jgi:acetyl/propionyl-CoA carboxylase alpha subunit/acetyl-CoA carboxylase carboxyltransferase component
MSFKKILIANRGEIAVRISRAADELHIPSVAIFPADDARSLHVKSASESQKLEGVGAAAYLDGEQVINIARNAECDAVHPGYGFLSENGAFARACADAGLRFIGPSPENLDLFGNKVYARELAKQCGVSLLPGTDGDTSVEDAHAFFKSLGSGGAVMIKALAGGGGRGMRPVRDASELDQAYERCRSEAKMAFGEDAVYVEQLIPKARHIEIQVIGDGRSAIQLGERECSVQRQRQKLVEIAPSPNLPTGIRNALVEAALVMARAAELDSLATFEFLVDADGGDDATFAFMEVNPRLQVEHTVTEEVTGVDLVKTQIRLAQGATLADLGLAGGGPEARGHAIQIRVNMESLDKKGQPRPSVGRLDRFAPPAGPGVRVDSFGYEGYETSPHYDSLLAKVIAHSPSPDYGDAVARAYRALSEFHIEGVRTNIPFHMNLLKRPEFATNSLYTEFVADNAEALIDAPKEVHPKRYFEGEAGTASTVKDLSQQKGPAGSDPIVSPLQGRVVSIAVADGDTVSPGEEILILDAMKMEHAITASVGGIVRKVTVKPEDIAVEGQALIYVEPSQTQVTESAATVVVDPDFIRPDLQEVIERHAYGLDENRPDAVGRRRKRNQRTARENVEDLCDEGSFIEYGPLILAAQRRRRSMEELIKSTPGDGMVSGIGAVNGAQFDEEKARAMVLSYDFTVLAGTQGMMNHKKTDRMLQLAHEWKLPLFMLAEGGGGRPGDTDTVGVAGLDITTFLRFAELSGNSPVIGVTSGRCFAGNAALLGCCDVIIATANSNIGMGGPAMIEGGGLGVYKPEDVGPMDVQRPNGVVDIAVEDESEAIGAAKKYFSYFQGAVDEWDAPDQRGLRQLIPENRLRAYDVRTVIDGLADNGSVLELRPEFGIGILTCLIRLEGHPFGVIANNPFHLGGAIDADAGDKAARFLQLCEAFGLPVLSLCDTPGFMVGPEVETQAQVRHVSRMFVTAASMRVPMFTIVLRKGYGLGAQAMAGGSFHAPFFIVSWPTGEFGGMGLEGAVRLGYRREMEAIEDPKEREAFYEERVARSYENGKAINMASFLEIDEVIDPADTRKWILRGLKSVPAGVIGVTGNRPFIDTW